MPGILLDTNVLVYAFDPNDAARQAQALRCLKALAETQQGCLSVQCLAEFMAIATRKLRPALTPANALDQVTRLAQAYRIYDITLPVVLEAARGLRDYQLSYYDAQIWATAHLHQVPVVFSEDFGGGAQLEGVRFVNPFAPRFNLETWL